MAFATSQSIDQLLTRGLSFRLPNNAPISSLYTLYANGAGMTYWSNSMNPRDLSTLSSAIGEVGSTVIFQQTEIDDLYGQVSTLSTTIYTTSNALVDYFNSTITGISTFSTFYNDLASLSNVVEIGLSTLSTAITVTNSTSSAFLRSTLTSSFTAALLSSSTGLYNYTNRVSSATVYTTTFNSTTAGLNRAILSTGGGLGSNIATTNLALSTNISTLRWQTFSTNVNFFSTISGYGPRIGRLETASTGISTFTNNTASTLIATSQSTQNSFLNSRFAQLSTYVSTIAVFATAQFGSLSSLSSALYTSISTISAVDAEQNAAISSLARNLSILTTSSILAGVYDTFTQLEAYTLQLIGSTITTMQYWQSSLYYSTIIQNVAISDAYFSTFTGSAYQSTVSATTALVNAYVSTYTSTAVGVQYSTNTVFINNLNSTTIGTLYSTGYSYLLSTLSETEVGIPLNSTVVFIGSNAGKIAQDAFAVAIGFNAGESNQGSSAVAIGLNAGESNQGSSAIAIGENAGIDSQASQSIAIGRDSGQSNQGNLAIAIGFQAGQTSQQESAVAVGYSAGAINQGSNSIGIGTFAGESNQGRESIAIGFYSGTHAQGSNVVAIGYNAGYSNQSDYAIALGPGAGNTSQGSNAIAIGQDAGGTSQDLNAIAIGQGAGYASQGLNAIAIGFSAGSNSQPANSIILNASNVGLDAFTEGFFVNPVRSNAFITDGFLHYDIATNELVYNDVGGSGGGGITSTFNDIYFSTARGIAVTGANVYGTETARIVDYYTPLIPESLRFVSTFGSPNDDLLMAAMSADGKYQIFTNGNGSLAGSAGYMMRSDNYGATFQTLTGAGQSNWEAAAVSRSGQIMYVACSGSNVSPGGLLKSTDYGATFTLLPQTQSIDTIWGVVACSGDGKIVFASPGTASGDPSSRISYISYDYGGTFSSTGQSAFHFGASMSITGQYILFGDPLGGSLLRVSKDYGQTWATPGGVVVAFVGTAMSADGKYMFAGRNGPDIYRSDDYGTNFSITSISGVTGGGTADIYQISCDDTGQYVVAAASTGGSSADGGYLYSSDYGQTFNTIANLSLAYGICISKNTQYLLATVRSGSFYTGSIPTYFPAGTFATSTIATSVVATTARFNVMNVSTMGGFSPITFTDDAIFQSSTILSNVYVTGSINNTGSFVITDANASNVIASTIGINTTAPEYRLDVAAGTIRSCNAANTSSCLVLGAGYNNTYPLSHGAPAIRFDYAMTNGGYPHYIISRHDTTVNSTGNALDFWVHNIATQYGIVGTTANKLAMSVTAAGVGVGTSNPSFALDVTGSVRATTSTIANVARFNVMNVSTIGGFLPITFVNDVIFQSNAFMSNVNISGSLVNTGSALMTRANASTVIASTIGINTVTPLFNLDVNGTARVSSFFYNQQLYTNAIQPTGIFHVINGYNDAGSNWGYSQWFYGRTTGGGVLASTMQLYSYAGGTICNSLNISPIGNVGIGTRETVPAYNLHVNGNMGIQSTIFFTPSDPGDMVVKDYGNLTIGRYGIGQYANGTMRMFAASTLVSATVNLSFARNFDRSGTAGATAFFDALTVYPTGRVSINAAPGASTLTSFSADSLYINSGKIAYDPNGIASIVLGGSNHPYARIYGQDTSIGGGPYIGDLVFQTRYNPGVAGLYERMRIRSDGNVGIGTPTPTQLMEMYKAGTNVSSILRISAGDGISSSNKAGIEFYTRGGGGGYLQHSIVSEYDAAGNYGINFRNGFVNAGTSLLRLDMTNLRVGINCNSPSNALDILGNLSVTGNAYKTGGGSWTSISDMRVKKNIVSADLSLCLSNLKAINLRHFEWDENFYDSNILKDRHILGFIAQEVKEIFPKSVEIADFRNFSSFHSLNVDQIYAANVGATQRLAQLVDAAEDFTGTHRCFPADSDTTVTSNIGKVVIATGSYQSVRNGVPLRGLSSITTSEALPLVSLARNAKDRRCFGVIGSNASNNRLLINSVGEGGIWVCEANGAVQNGDYLTTCDITGYAMKQGEEYIANYTVAKATMDCDFSPLPLPSLVPRTSTIEGVTVYLRDSDGNYLWEMGSSLEPPYELRYIDINGSPITKATYETLLAAGAVAYKAAFIGCTYHCG